MRYKLTLYYATEVQDTNHIYNAGLKAPTDIEMILSSNNIATKLPLHFDRSWQAEGSGVLQKASGHTKTARAWLNLIDELHSGDVLILQYPSQAHTVFYSSIFKKCIRNNIKTIVFLHDVPTLRIVVNRMSSVTKNKVEDDAIFKYSDIIIAHNKEMKEQINKEFQIPNNRIIDLGLFDYLTDYVPIQSSQNDSDMNSIIVAGNLSRSKAAYLYDEKLPMDLHFRLYGPSYDGSHIDNVELMGCFPPDELPSQLKGNFGLVWDGDSCNTCSGIYGAYLRINNPHKASLYLVSGLPLIVWEESALADFVKEKGCGLTISSLYQISEKIKSLSAKEYKQMRENAIRISQQLRDGFFTKRAIMAALNRLADERDPGRTAS